MISSPRGPSSPQGRVPPTRGRHGIAAAAAPALESLAGGRLAKLPVAVAFWDGSCLPVDPPRQVDAGRNASEPGSRPVVIARAPRAVSHLLHEPSELGLARAWVDGSLTVQGDLEKVLALRPEFSGLQLSHRERLRLALTAVRVAGPGVLRRPPAPAIEASVGGRRHTPARDRRAVRHHYDLSNDFYRLVLGPSMVYSCAYFGSADETLEQAQERKLDLICRKLALAPDQRMLDIGCGWGSLVIHGAANYGVRAVGVTLSEPRRRSPGRGSASMGCRTGWRFASPITVSSTTVHTTRWRASGCTSTSAGPSWEPTSPGCMRSSRRGACSSTTA